jgi:hypothetical protein
MDTKIALALLFFNCFCGKLSPMSLLGERLRQAREARGLAPLQVEMDTRIRATVIQALEQSDYASLPPEPFVRGLIRTYSTYLGLDSEEMLELYIADRTPPPPVAPVRPAPSPHPPATRPEAAVPTTQPPATPSPPPATPAESSEVPASLPPAEPVQKPTAIRFPSLRPPLPRPPARKPNLPIPPAPPESLAPPESITPATPSSTDASTPEQTSLAHFTRHPAPLPVIIAMIAGAVCVCLVIGFITFLQISPMLNQLAGWNGGTPTRLSPTRTPTLRPGTNPTAIPTLGATAPPLPFFPGNPTAALKATLRPAPETFSGLNLDVVEVTQTITLRVGVDGVLVFSGQMQPGVTRSWSAKDSLYVQIENPKGATLELNGSVKWFAPRNFAETKTLERQWTIIDQGTPISTTPVAPAALPATTPILAPPRSPTPTLTPFS